MIDRDINGEPTHPIFALLDEAWYAETKGELQYEDSHVEMILAMRDMVRESADTVAGPQYGARYSEELDVVSEEEVARRIAAALSVLLWGGHAAG